MRFDRSAHLSFNNDQWIKISPFPEIIKHRAAIEQYQITRTRSIILAILIFIKSISNIEQFLTESHQYSPLLHNQVDQVIGL